MSNTSNLSSVDNINETTKVINIFNYVLYTLIVVLGVPGNILVVWALLSTRREQVNRSYKMLVINLAINDIMVVVITSPFQIAELTIGDYYPFGSVMCSLLWPLQTACSGAGVFNMVALNVHRYYVISYPTSRRALGKVTYFAVALCWVIPTLITALPYAVILEYTPKNLSCSETWSKYTADAYTVYLFSVQYILPLIVIATLNLLTIRRLKRRYVFRVNCTRQSDDNLLAHRKIVKMLIFIILIFALFGLPGQIMWLIPVMTKIDHDSNYFPILALVDIFNHMYCVLNPVLFFTYNTECYDRMKKFLASMFACCGYRCEISSSTGTHREGVTTLLPVSRTSDSQDTSQSEGPRLDPKYAPAYLLEKHNQDKAKRFIDTNRRSVPVALFSTFSSLYAPVVSCEDQGKSSLEVTDEEIFRGSFVEILRTGNVLMRKLDESPETAIVEQEGTQNEKDCEDK